MSWGKFQRLSDSGTVAGGGSLGIVCLWMTIEARMPGRSGKSLLAISARTRTWPVAGSTSGSMKTSLPSKISGLFDGPINGHRHGRTGNVVDAPRARR